LMHVINDKTQHTKYTPNEHPAARLLGSSDDL